MRSGDKRPQFLDVSCRGESGARDVGNYLDPGLRPLKKGSRSHVADENVRSGGNAGVDKTGTSSPSSDLGLGGGGRGKAWFEGLI